ncbi:GTPase ObgE [Candidatus Saccharibacteria bacterium]|nr:GTPase ObgE [Candidatus Saccharibacteria bacterium]
MFADTAIVRVVAGRGGDGAVSFRHEKFIDKGGPDGGNGGKGGNVVFVADDNTNTLVDFRMKQEIKAQDGQTGGKQNKHGRNGQDIQVKVPVGTVVMRDGVLVADLVTGGEPVVVARGGDGGFGNAHFKSSTRQAPRVAELGEDGEAFEANLELKLLADVGLVGMPNAGKSTFLSVVSNARPEIGDYAFTTLTPNLGVADVNGTGLLIADIPGLIEGASEGKGLGDAFLRHIERTVVILHLIDAYQDDPSIAYKTIRKELEQYGESIANLPEIVALTKIEGLDPEILQMQIDSLKSAVDSDVQVFALSAQAHLGILPVLRALLKQVESTRQEEAAEDVEEVETLPVISLDQGRIDSGWEIERRDNKFVVSGAKIEKFARRTDTESYHGLARLRDIMRKLGVTHELLRQGAKGSSTIEIAGKTFTLTEQ